MCHGGAGAPMCVMTERSGWLRTTPRPRWGRLYALGGLMLAALAVVEVLVSPRPELTALRCGLVLGGFGAIVQWTRRNRAALDHLDWCDCASERVTMRVIPSRRGSRRVPRWRTGRRQSRRRWKKSRGSDSPLA